MLGLLQGSNVKLTSKLATANPNANSRNTPINPTIKKKNLRNNGRSNSRFKKEDSTTTDSDSGVGLASRRRRDQAVSSSRNNLLDNKRISSPLETTTATATTAGQQTKTKFDTARRFSVPEQFLSASSSSPVAPPGATSPTTSKFNAPRRFSKCEDTLDEIVPFTAYTAASTSTEQQKMRPISLNLRPAEEVEIRPENNVQPQQQPTTRRNYDDLLLEESANLAQELESLCNEFGIDSTKISASTTRLSNSNRKRVTIVEHPQRYYDEDEEGICSVSCPNSARSCAKTELDEEEEEDSSEPTTQSKPSSILSLGDSKSGNVKGIVEKIPAEKERKMNNTRQVPETDAAEVRQKHSQIYSRLISTLHLIEQDQQDNHKASSIQEQDKTSNPPPGYNNKILIPERLQLNSSMSFSESDIHYITSGRNPSFRPPMQQQQQQLNSKVHCGSGDGDLEPELIKLDSSSPSSLASPSSPSPNANVLLERPKSILSVVCNCPEEDKSKNIYSFLDEIEKSDRDLLFSLKFDQDGHQLQRQSQVLQQAVSSSVIDRTSSSTTQTIANHKGDLDSLPISTMDSLVRKGSVELAKEFLLLNRKYEDSLHSVRVLEDTLLSQRELNMRNLKNSEKDLRKRLHLQQEEFELAITRQQSFLDQILAEKRSMQDKCEKLLQQSKETESKYQTQIKSLQEKHLEEIKRLRRMQDSQDKVNKQKWTASKTAEIKNLTVKGLEPEVQRLIIRHQQEMNEMRAWHSDELQEIQERFGRKQIATLQEMKERFLKEKDSFERRLEEKYQITLKEQLEKVKDGFEIEKRKLLEVFEEEKKRANKEKEGLREELEEKVRKAEVKGQTEIENLQREHSKNIETAEKRHEAELTSIKDVYEAEKINAVSNLAKKHEQALVELETTLREQINTEKGEEMIEKEKKVRTEYEKLRKEDEEAAAVKLRRITEKYQTEITDLENTETHLKSKLTTLKSNLLHKEEELFTIKTTLATKLNENTELTESNTKMFEERINLTSAIRHEFKSQIETLENECSKVKATIIELKSKHKLELDNVQHEKEKALAEKDIEIEKIGYRIKQAMERKEETLLELQKQLEKCQLNCAGLEKLLEQQRQEFVASLVVGRGGGNKSAKSMVVGMGNSSPAAAAASAKKIKN